MGRYRIITCDGGGVRGALTSSLLARLDAMEPGLLAAADLFAGTSTGSFIALGLAAGKTTQELVALYSESRARYVFTPAHLDPRRPRYDNAHLRQVLIELFSPHLTLRDLPRRVLVCAFELAGPAGGPWRPVCFTNFRRSPYLKMRVVDAALASSAAPAYFPSHQGYIDGGVVANNPCLAAVTAALAAEHGNQPLADIVTLSLGTGYDPERLSGDTAKWGTAQWAVNPLPPPLFPLLSVLLAGNAEAAATYAAAMLGARFFRLNPYLNRAVSLDDYTAVPYLKQVADRAELGPALTWIRRFWL